MIPIVEVTHVCMQPVIVCSIYSVKTCIVYMYLYFVVEFLPAISPLPIIRTVGKDYNISCTVSTPVGLNNSVNFTWETPSSVVIDNDRVTINNFVVVDLSTRIHYSTLQFAYYKETDFGRYNCLVMVDDESELLSAELTRSTARSKYWAIHTYTHT